MAKDEERRPERTSEAVRLVAELNANTGANLHIVGLAALGEVSGAVYVRWPDGHDGVLTPSPCPRPFLELIGDVLERARSLGAPVPRYEMITELQGCTAIVQERLPGSPVQVIDPASVDAIVAANERLAGVAPDWPEVHVPELHLRESGPDFCLHETLANFDDRSRRLLDWIHEVGKEAPTHLTGNDLVHWDLVPGNVLFDDSGVTGIVDWDGIGRGDRRFSLIKLRFFLAHRAVLHPNGYPQVEPSAILRLDERLRDTVEPASLRFYWAHWSLSIVDWAIRHGARADADQYLDIATSRIQ